MIDRCRDYRRAKKITGCDAKLGCIYLMEVQDGKDMGVWMFEPEAADRLYLVHAYMTGECRGKKAADSAREAFRWMFDNTWAEAIGAVIPAYRPDVAVMAVTTGMKCQYQEGMNRIYRIDNPNKREKVA